MVFRTTKYTSSFKRQLPQESAVAGKHSGTILMYFAIISKSNDCIIKSGQAAYNRNKVTNISYHMMYEQPLTAIISEKSDKNRFVITNNIQSLA